MLSYILDKKVLKTKTEIATLTEFLAWLQKVNGTDKNGVIFVYHEQVKFVPYMMIEKMKKYNLWDRFEKIVKGFVNWYHMIDDGLRSRVSSICHWQTISAYKKSALDCLPQWHRKTARSVEEEEKASRRAELSYEICK